MIILQITPNFYIPLLHLNSILSYANMHALQIIAILTYRTSGSVFILIVPIIAASMNSPPALFNGACIVVRVNWKNIVRIKSSVNHRDLFGRRLVFERGDLIRIRKNAEIF